MRFNLISDAGYLPVAGINVNR